LPETVLQVTGLVDSEQVTLVRRPVVVAVSEERRKRRRWMRTGPGLLIIEPS
jgi:hypothetical protein